MQKLKARLLVAYMMELMVAKWVRRAAFYTKVVDSIVISLFKVGPARAKWMTSLSPQEKSPCLNGKSWAKC